MSCCFSRYGLLKLFLNEALLEFVLLSCLVFRGLAVCPSDCSCSRSHREVDCSWKGLRQLPDGLQYNIRSLVLSHNRFHSLDGKLQQYTHLRLLDLSHNRLSRLPKNLPRSLWQLSASFNHIKLLDKNDTVYQWNLQTLDLSNNKLERAIFINNTLINLLTLNLSHNHFWTLPTNLPHHLETIDLSHNLLVNVLPGSLDRLPRLTHFYLHANRFSSLPSGVLDNMVSLRIITLSSNPWACHLYEDMAYLLSWAQQTSVLVLGCPCHTQPVCGGLRPSRSGGWHFTSYTSPPLAAKTPDLSSVPPEARVTWWWQLLAQLSTPHTPKDASNFPPSSTFTADTHPAINHFPASASPVNIDHLLSGKKETSPSYSLHTTDSLYFSDKSLITEISKENEMATDRFFTTEIPSIQTKKTTTLRTRSVRRQNQSPPGGSSSGCAAPASCTMLLFLHNMGLLSVIAPRVL